METLLIDPPFIFFGGFISALIGAGASLLGGYLQNKSNEEQANSANQLTQQQFESAQDFNSAEAQKNKDFQKEMSNTAHQREVIDLRRAGLNPILSAKGPGASTPSGDSGSIQGGQGVQAHMQDIITPAVHTANAWRQTDSQIKLQQAQTAGQTATTSKTLEEIKNLPETRKLTQAQVTKIAEEIGGIKANIEKIKAQTRGQIQLNDMKQVIVDFLESGQLQELASQAGEGIHLIKKIFIDNLGRWIGETVGSIPQGIKEGWRDVNAMRDSANATAKQAVTEDAPEAAKDISRWLTGIIQQYIGH